MVCNSEIDISFANTFGKIEQNLLVRWNNLV